MKLFIVANRLPIKVLRNENGQLEFIRSEGGLATGLSSLDTSIERHWIGWPGITPLDKAEQSKITHKLESMNYHPVFLTEDQVEDYYEGFSNNAMWPLCHYFYAYVEYDKYQWSVYKQVNELFGYKALEKASPGDIIWVHDYQLMLVPNIIRKKSKDLSIGYFHHIPFPSYELFRILPERAEILKGLLGADLIAFHTHDYMRHFISTVERVMGLEFNLDKVHFENRNVYVEAIPMGINYKLYNDAILNKEVQEKALTLKKNYGNRKLILSVDRLDYSKGILHRLKGFANFLDNHPEYNEAVSLVMVVVPSRNKVDRYAELKKNIDETIGAINGKHSTINWTPVFYFYHNLSFEDLLAMYHIADIALVSPLRDGMNLVAKEYVAAKRDSPGVLILSEMAGAATELQDAININPNDVDQIGNALVEALEMSTEEKLMSIYRMQQIISRQTVNKWAEDFIEELLEIRSENQANDKKRIGSELSAKLRKSYQKSEKRLIILDYDGTLSPFKNKPEDAFPTPDIIDVLKRLSKDKKNRIVISSGRDHKTLESWLGQLPIDMSAEHGAFYKEHGIWIKKEGKMEWSEEILDILQNFIDKTPRSKLEIKETALVWHYRKVDEWLASLREQQLVNELISPCARLNLQIMRGNKIVEIKSPLYTKGSEVKRILQNDKYDYILAIGDDVTDEDTFRALPRTSVTVKIGGVSPNAKYYLKSQSETLNFLKSLMH